MAFLLLWQEESYTAPSWVGGGRLVWSCVAWISGLEVKSSAFPRAGRGTGWGGRIQVEMQWEEGGKKKKGILFLSCRLPSLSVSLPHSAVASQLVPRGTWRHLVSVRTGAGTAEGCGRFSSAPAAGEAAADARLQGVTGAVTPKRAEQADASAAYTVFLYNAGSELMPPSYNSC